MAGPVAITSPGRLKTAPAVFVACFLFFAAIRSLTPLVHDDTAVLRKAVILTQESSEHQPSSLLAQLARRIGSPRCVSFMIQDLGVNYMRSGYPDRIWFLFSSGILALSACAFYLLADLFMGQRIFSLYATALLVASPPFISSSWVTFAGLQSLVYLVFSLGLFLYFRTDQAVGKGCALRWIALCGLFLIGPFIREVLIVLPACVFSTQLLRRRFASGWTWATALFIPHGMYPAALYSLFRGEPVQSVFRMISTNWAMDPDTHLRHLRWEFFAGYPFLIPPLLLLLVLALATGMGLAFRRTPAPEPAARPPWWPLGLLFAMLTLPFLRVYALPVHLGYSLIGLAIAVALVLQAAWRRWKTKWPRAGILLVMGVSTLAQFSNVYGSVATVLAINDGLLRCVAALDRHAPPGSLVISNTIFMKDINLFSGWKYVHAFTTLGDDDFKRYVTGLITPDKLQGLIERPVNDKPLFFLEADFPGHLEFIGDEADRLFRDPGIVLDDLGASTKASAVYPVLDPLAWLMPKSSYVFLGTPDYAPWVYHGPDIGGRPLLAQSYVRFRLYRVNGRKAREP